MAPTKRPARNQKTKKSATKRVRLDTDVVSKEENGEEPPKTSSTTRTRSSGMATADAYSPSVDSSEFSDLTEEEEEEEAPKKVRLSLLEDSADDDDETQDAGSLRSASVSDGKSIQRKRAARRVAERAHQVDLTDDDEGRDVGVEVVDPGPPRPVSINGKSAREMRADRRRAEREHEVDLTDEEEELAVNTQVDTQDASQNVEVDSENRPDPIFEDEPEVVEDEPASQNVEVGSQDRLDLIFEDEEDEVVEDEPVTNGDAENQQKSAEGVELDSNADAEGETDVEEPAASVEAENQARSENVSPEPSANVERKPIKKDVRFEDIDFTIGAAARYVEFMKQRGHAASELFGSRPASDVLSDSSWSSSSSSSYFTFDNLDEEFELEEPDDVENSSAPLVDHGNKNTETNDTNDIVDNDNKISGISELNDSYLVFRRDKTIDDLLSNHLRTIARVLNFIARARESGIEIGDFESLTAVEPERWAGLVEAPEYAADFVVQSLLELSVWDICLLSERAATLQSEMEALGVII